MKNIRILNVLAIMNRGGLETMIMNHYREINREKVQFDFLVHRTDRGHYDNEILELGGRIFYLPKFNPLNIKEYNMALNKFFIDNPEYKIVHSHYNALGMWTLRAAMKNNVPIRIAHSHLAFPSLDFKTPFFEYGKLKINQYCTHRFACGEDAGEWLFGKKEANNIHIINNAIDSKSFVFNSEISSIKRKEFGIEGKFVLGHIARFHKAKNHDFLIDIFKEVHERNKNSVLMLVGDGGQREKIQKKVKELNLEDSVIFTGVRSDIPELLQAFDIFVFPSIIEGLPVTLIEAQSSGLKCIVSENVTEEVDVSGLVEFISLKKPASYWADAILKYKNGYDRKDMYKEIKEAGYDVKENAKWLENFYINGYEKSKGI